MANKIQLRRDTTANWENVNPVLADGEPGLDITTNQVKYGDGANAWVDLSYASGGGGVTFDANGMLVLTGNLWLGTWVDDDSVLWAPDTSEYVGLWYGGERDPEASYGPNVSITAGNVAFDDPTVTTSWPDGPQVNIDIMGNNWHFAADGSLTFPQGSSFGSPGEGEFSLFNLIDTDFAIYTNNGTNHGWLFGTDGNLTLPAGGEIHSTAGTGPVTIQANDGSNPRNFVFNTSGSLSLPHLAAGAQGAGAFDANNNLLTLTSSDTVDFANFSGMIVVNCHNSGTVSLYLCGGGGGGAVSIGNSKVTGTGTMAHNNGIGGYTFTATETGDHVFCAIRTRTGA